MNIIIFIDVLKAAFLHSRIYKKPEVIVPLIKIAEQLVDRFRSKNERKMDRFLFMFADPGSFALILRNLGAAYMALPTGDRVDNVMRAISCYQEALSIHTLETNALEYAIIHINLSNAYLVLPTGDQFANVKQAIACSEEALDYLTPQRAPQEYAYAQHNLSVACLMEGWLGVGDGTADRVAYVKRAIYCDQEALHFHTPKTKPLDYSRIQRNMGRAYRVLSTIDAEDSATYLRHMFACFQEALRFFTPETAPLEYATIQDDLGDAYFNLSTGDRTANLEQAITCYQKALRFLTPETAPFNYALVQRSLGEAYLALPTRDQSTDMMRAVTCYQEALRFLTPDTSPLQCLLTTDDLGNIYFMQGKWQDALNTYKAAIAAGDIVYRSSLSSVNKEFEVVLSENLYRNAAFAAVRCGKTTDALSILEQGKTRLLTEALHLGIRRPIHLPDEIWQAFEHASTSARSVLLDAVGTGRVSTSMVTPLTWKTKATAEVNLTQIYTSHVQEVQRANEALNAAIKQIRVYAPDFLQEIDLSITQSLLSDKDSALLAFCITEQGGLAFIVTQNRSQVVDIPAFTRTDLADLFNGWSKGYNHFRDDSSNALGDWQETIVSTLAFLGHRLLSPILSALPPDIKHIILLPSAELFLFPLHAVPLSDTHTELLCDRYQISYAPSIGVLADARGKAMKEVVPELYAIINPDAMLPFAPIEGAAITRLFAQSEVDKGRIATKQRVLTRIYGKSYVHFACRGNYDWNEPKKSGVELADERFTLADMQQGVADFSATRLVTLSACETGMIDVLKGSAEEYVGISAGFMLSGVPCVVSSLWFVNDVSTALLMERFYHNHLVDKMDFVTALQETQQWVRGLSAETVAEYVTQCFQQSNQGEKAQWYQCMRYYQHKVKENPAQHPFEHPYFWAAFTINGW